GLGTRFHFGCYAHFVILSMSSPGLTGRPSIPEAAEIYEEAAAYWIPRWSLSSGGASRRPGGRGMTSECWAMLRATSPPEPFRLARQLDGLDFLELDRALGHQIVDVAVGRARNLRAVEIDLHRAAMVLLGPGRGVADAFHAGRHPILLLVEAFRDVLAGRAAVLGGPVERFLQIERAADGRDVVHGPIDLAGRIR